MIIRGQGLDASKVLETAVWNGLIPGTFEPQNRLTHGELRTPLTRDPDWSYKVPDTVTHTVLVCDDAPYMRTLLGRILERGGFQVVGEAETGLEAVEKYKTLRPDVVTMDIVMRELGGIDAVRKIRQFDDKAKILMCSALAQPGLVAEAMEAGASDFVMKPFQASHLLEAVQHVLA